MFAGFDHQINAIVVITYNTNLLLLWYYSNLFFLPYTDKLPSVAEPGPEPHHFSCCSQSRIKMKMFSNFPFINQGKGVGAESALFCLPGARLGTASK
jgi:hypothetical protein